MTYHDNNIAADLDPAAHLFDNASELLASGKWRPTSGSLIPQATIALGYALVRKDGDVFVKAAELAHLMIEDLGENAGPALAWRTPCRDCAVNDIVAASGRLAAASDNETLIHILAIGIGSFLPTIPTEDRAAVLADAIAMMTEDL